LHILKAREFSGSGAGISKDSNESGYIKNFQFF